LYGKFARGTTTKMKLLAFFAALARDQNGAALVEYTILVAVGVVVALGMTHLMTGDVSGTWSALHEALRAAQHFRLAPSCC
jgi:Flp pilus assembly pilin Flp